MLLSRPNLLRLYDANPEPSPLPTASPTDCRTGALVSYAGEENRFYWNVNFLSNGFASSPIVSLVSQFGGTPVAVSATTIIDTINADGKTFYGSWNTPSVPPGLYRWRMIWANIANYTLNSNLIEVLPEADARACSVRIEYRNSRKSIQGIRWPWIASDFSQAFRIRALLENSPFVVENTSYREVTTGRTVTLNQAQDRVLSFRVPPTDPESLAGLATALVHDTLKINGLPVTVKDHVSTQAFGRGSLFTGTFSVIDDSFAQPLIP